MEAFLRRRKIHRIVLSRRSIIKHFIYSMCNFCIMRLFTKYISNYSNNFTKSTIVLFYFIILMGQFSIASR
nr:MAG TPA: hypothetical protein [Caudoviricetes sp.]